MREICTPGSVRGAARKGRPYRDPVRQSFLATFLEKDFLKSVSPEKGRFRTFLLVALDGALECAPRIRNDGG